MERSGNRTFISRISDPRQTSDVRGLVKVTQSKAIENLRVFRAGRLDAPVKEPPLPVRCARREHYDIVAGIRTALGARCTVSKVEATSMRKGNGNDDSDNANVSTSQAASRVT